MITLPENTTFIGELRSSGRIRIDGHFEGDGHIDGLLVLSKTCVWKGRITADVIVIEGTVEGEVLARKRLQIAATAEVVARITTPEIAISEGARVSGEIRMAAPQPPVGLLELRKHTAESEQGIEQLIPKQAVGA